MFFYVLMIVAALYANSLTAQTNAPGGANTLSLPDGDVEIIFTWQGDSVNNRWEPFAALLIPVKLANCPKQFYMQFDTGAPYTVFYSHPLKEIQSKYPGSIQLQDSSAKFLNTNLIIGKKSIACRQAGILEFGKTPDNGNKSRIRIIGTLGVDLIDNRTVVIDYPRKRMLISNAVPARLLPRINLTGFMYARNSILLPAILQGKKTMLYFDSGSSAHSLLASKETSLSLAQPGAIPVQYSVKSWDRMLTANTLVTNDSIEIASQRMPLKNVTYIEGASDTQVQQMLKLGIGGLTGNKLFVHSVLVLDVKNRKFGIAAD